MKIKFFLISVVVLACAFLVGDKRPVAAETQVRRIRFQVTAIGETAGESSVLAQTTIEGLPGTDFKINLRNGSFKMEARFLSDLVSNDKIRIKASLETRRSYGYSARNLPLYEEDTQKHTLDLGFDQAIELLPFGGGGGTDVLKIEIVPKMVYLPQGPDAAKLTIDFDKKMPGGEISIEASKTPHTFDVEAVITADGKPVAKGNCHCFIEEPQEMILDTVAVGDAAFSTRVTIKEFIRGGPAGMASFGFDLDRIAEGAHELVIANGAGVGLVGDSLSYPLTEISARYGKKYELKFRIKLAE